MSVVRSMIVPIFVIVVICYCRCAEIPNQDINFDLFQNQPKSFDDQILGALKAKDGFWSGEKGKQIFQVAGAVLKVIPQLHLLGTALPLLHSLLLEDNSWIGELSKTIPLGVKLEITKDDITKIKNDINTIKEDIRQLESNALDEDVVSAKLDRIEATLYHIINGFFKGDSPYRPFPTIALPTLFALASFIANIVPLTIALSPDRAQLSRVPCLLAETITDYFQPILSERLRQVKVSAKNWRKNFPSNDVYQENSFQTPFNPNASKREQNNIRCGRIGKGENLKLTKENLILRDELNKNEDYFDDINGNCVQDYLALVRNRMETKFGEAFAAVDKFCTDEIRNRTRNPTGNAHLLCDKPFFVSSSNFSFYLYRFWLVS